MQYRIESSNKINNTTEQYTKATSCEMEQAERIQELEDKVDELTWQIHGMSHPIGE